MNPTRRGLIGGTGLLGLAAAAPAAPAAAAAPDRSPVTGDPHGPADAVWLQRIVEDYAAFGDKASGGPGDTASGRWLEEQLAGFGYACRRQPFEVPFYEARQATLAVGGARATLIPQAPVASTGPRGLTAPIRRADDGVDLSGAIALIVLPHKRWASLSDPQVEQPLADARRRGAAGVVLVTTGPTGEAIALNVSTHRPAFDRPVAILAPKDAQPFIAAAGRGETATLTLLGEGSGGARRPAFNLIARRDRRAAKTLVVSTPRSGWFGCAAERGSGLAVWLSLARWLAKSDFAVNVELLATSGHEYDYLGGEHYLADQAPPPAATRLWVHVGASVAARDWHELGAKLLPLPSADSQRVLTASSAILDGTRAAFRGVNGLEAAYLADKTMAGGELVNVLAAGYPSAIGMYGIHRYFHTRGDDLRCVSGELVKPVADALQVAIGRSLS